MNVAVFTDHDFDRVNGVTTSLWALLRFAPRDVRPRLYTAADVAVETPSYFAAASLGAALPWYREMRLYWPRLAALRRAVRDEATTLVHVTTPGPVGLAGRAIARQLGLPLVGSYHTQLGDHAAAYSGSRRVGRHLEDYLRWFYRRCAILYVPSESTLALLAERGYDRHRLRVWPAGVDVDEFTPERRSFTLRQRWRADAPRPVILYAGRLSREKGLDLVPAIRRALLRHGLQGRFVFAGDGPMRPVLDAQCPDGLFLGVVPHDRMGAILASADVFLFPSASDTLGHVVLEAQAAGVPAVVSDRGGPQHHMLADRTGLVAPAGDADAFGRALQRLITRPDQRREMGREARAYACTRTWPEALVPLVDGWRAVAADTAAAATARPAARSCA